MKNNYLLYVRELSSYETLALSNPFVFNILVIVIKVRLVRLQKYQALRPSRRYLRDSWLKCKVGVKLLYQDMPNIFAYVVLINIQLLAQTTYTTANFPCII